MTGSGEAGSQQSPPPASGEAIDGDVAGDARIAAAVDRLGDAERAPLHEQAEIYADIHSRLNSAMAEVRTD
ncbi:MAG: hypothetical protein QG671_1105 [Actinomycetota bacterium]|jgi:hypothetical protein|nr:hypothetical protein [Actinomycetota bacterium]